MNTDYYENTDVNFTQALNLFEGEYSHDELITLLRSGNIVQRQISALRLEQINSCFDADVLLSNLTGQDGKIREVVSLKLNDFISNPHYRYFFNAAENFQVFLDAVIDINANICRNVISAIKYLRDDVVFCERFSCGLVKMSKEFLDSVEKFNFQEGKYKVNKEVFKLYWCLETIYVLYDKINFADLKEIVLRAKSIQDYTIREKAAKILTRNFNDEELIKAQEELKQDNNYYVRRF